MLSYILNVFPILHRKTTACELVNGMDSLQVKMFFTITIIVVITTVTILPLSLSLSTGTKSHGFCNIVTKVQIIIKPNEIVDESNKKYKKKK